MKCFPLASLMKKLLKKCLSRIAPNFSEHHQLKIENDAITECVRLSKRYLKDRRLPDAAIDLLDRTMAAIKLMVDTNKGDLAESTEQSSNKIKNIVNVSEPELFNDYKWLNTVLQE